MMVHGRSSRRLTYRWTMQRRPCEVKVARFIGKKYIPLTSGWLPVDEGTDGMHGLSRAPVAVLRGAVRIRCKASNSCAFKRRDGSSPGLDAGNASNASNVPECSDVAGCAVASFKIRLRIGRFAEIDWNVGLPERLFDDIPPSLSC